MRLETECPEKIIIKRELLVENSRGLNNELEVKTWVSFEKVFVFYFKMPEIKRLRVGIYSG